MKKTRLLLGMLACATVISGLFASCGEQKKNDKIIGLQLYSVRDAMNEDPMGTLKGVAEIGYKELEMANYGNGKFYGMSPADFRKAVEDLGMKVTSSHVGYGLNKDDMEGTMAWWDTTINAHNAVGATYMVMPSPPVKLETTADLKDMADYLNAIGAKAKNAGLRFGYHNHHQEFAAINDTVIYEYLVENTDSANVFFELDVYWAQKGGYDPVELMKKYPDRIKLLHIKDDKEIGASGTMDFKAIYDQAYINGVEGFVVEQEAYSFPVMESVKQSFDYLNNAEFVK